MTMIDEIKRSPALMAHVALVEREAWEAGSSEKTPDSWEMPLSEFVLAKILSVQTN